MNVNIPNPCSENWAEMSTTQRGAFCQKCAVDVIDFSKKSALEVKETLRANIGKHMCGRFTTGQLTDLSHAYQVWENQSTRTFQSKFLWACMIAFDLTLFTGCESSMAQNSAIDGFNASEMNIVIDDSTKTDTTIVPQNVNDSIVYTDFVKGDIDMSVPAPEIEPELMWLGEFVTEIDEIETTVCNTTKEDSTEVILDPAPYIEPNKREFIMGKMQAPPKFEDYLADTVKIENIPQRIENETINAMVYPNPTTGMTKLKVQVNDNEHYAIELYNFQGEKLKTIFAGVIRKNEKTFKIDLSAYPSGTYLVKITSNYNAHALKPQFDYSKRSQLISVFLVKA